MKNDLMTNADGLGFKISTGLKRIIGRDLITNNLVAIFELVKNSFDANATRVDLVFEEDRLFVIDDGKGMSYEDIIDKWLFVAYSAKSDGTEDIDYRDQIETRKAYAGSKGVGRFSCDRLGSKLKLYTKNNISNHGIHTLTLDWDLFEKDNKQEFFRIPVQHAIETVFPTFKDIPAITHGTVLEITGLRDSWNRQELLNLKAALAKLINPFASDGESFSIYVHAQSEVVYDDLEELLTDEEDYQYNKIVNGKVRNFIFDTLRAKTTLLSVYLRDDGATFESSLVDRGELIYRIQETNPYPHLSGSEFSCQLFYLNQSAKLTFAKRMGLSTKNFGSVFLFRNGFRVFPVGEMDDDTFKINLRKQQGYARYLGTRDIVGRIDVTGKEDDFKESTSRDQGLIQTAASIQLVECFLEKCLKRLERYVVDVNWQDPLDAETEDISRLTGDKARARIIDVVSKLVNAKGVKLLDYSKDLIGIIDKKSTEFERSLANLRLVAEKTSNVDLESQITKAEKAYLELKKAEQDAREQAERERKARKAAEEKAQEEEKARRTVQVAYEEERKRNLFLTSSTSIDYDTIVNLHHQIGIYSSDINNILALQLDKLNDGETIDSETLINLFEQLSFKNQQILSVSRFATKANFRLDSDKIKDDLVVFIAEYIKEICSIYSGDGLDISVEYDLEGFVTEFKPIEISMLIDNLVDNSNKAGASAIKFQIRHVSGKELELTMSDDGRGLDGGITEPSRIFEKGFSTTSGSGLGLYHAKFILEQIGGGIRVNPDYPNGAQFIIRLRR